MRLFDKKKIRKNGEEDELLRIMSFVLYNQYSISEPEKLFRLYNEICDPNFKVSNIESKDNNILFQINGEIGFVAFMSAPFPWSDLEGPCSTSWIWRESKEVLQSHKSHAIVNWMTKNSEINALQKSIVVSQLTASIAQAIDALGIYWACGTLVLSKSQFVKSIVEMKLDDLPIISWIDFRVEKNLDGSFNLITTGLDVFEVMDIEILNSKQEFVEVFGLATNIANYLVINGNVIKDGDTIGENANEKIIVKHSKSVWDRPKNKNVLRIDF